MNLLVVGVSHRTAPVALLERVAVPPPDAPALLRALLGQSYVGEAVVLSTCNRVEIYAGVSGFHGALAEIGAVLAERAGVDVNTLAGHLYVRYDDEAVRHAYRVAAGLDSMVVGEAQILGQLRDAYAVAVEHDAVGRTLHELMQQALRVGKRAHSETGIDAAGRSVVTAALDLGLTRVGIPIQGARALVIGAGAMGGLALVTLRRAGAGPLTIANRSLARARRLADHHDATPVPLSDLPDVLTTVDVVLSATASIGQVLSAADLAAATGGRSTPLLVLDLAVPRDVDPAAGELPGVVLVDIAGLGDALAEVGSPAPVRTGHDGPAGHEGPVGHGGPAHSAVAAAEAIVADEVAVFLGWLRGADVAPTVAALRTRADQLVDGELTALRRRRPEFTDEQRADIARAVHRVVQRLLHQPTVRVRQMASAPGGDQYAAMLRELFDLDPATGPAAEAIEVTPYAAGPAAGAIEVRPEPPDPLERAR